PPSLTSCAGAHTGYPGQEAGVSSIPPTSLERNSAVTADKDVLGDGGRRRWAGRAARAAAGLMLGVALGVAGAGAASAVELNPQRPTMRLVQINPQVEINPQKPTMQFVEINPQ